MAPAAKASMQGRVGIRCVASNITAKAPIGSTTPLSEPSIKDFQRLLPAARIGIEMMAPSGMFCMAIPKDTEMAAANEICVDQFSAPANTTPTAIPSGRLCIVTARASIVVFDKCERKPSGLSVPI